MFFYLVDWLGMTWGLVCAVIIPILIGFWGIVGLLLFFGKKTLVMIVLSIVWYVLLFCFVGGIANHLFFIYITLLYVGTTASGILLFSGVFEHRILVYILCCVSFFLHGLPVCVGAKDSTSYTLMLFTHKNPEKIAEWGVEKMLTNDSNDRLSLAYYIKSNATDPISRGLADFCLENQYEAANFFTKARDEDSVDVSKNVLLSGMINYCLKEYTKSATFFIEADREAWSLVNAITATTDPATKKQMEKRLFLQLFNKLKKQPSDISTISTTGSRDVVGRLEISILLFVSLVWGQIITIPMIIFRN